MNIIVPIKQVPDLVEELEIDSSGKDLDREWIKYKLNEFDDHALEEALQIKESQGANVTVVAVDSENIDKVLYNAAAKGADRIVKLTGEFGPTVANHIAAKAIANFIQSVEHDLVMTGVQAVDDRDGQMAVLIAHYLGIPHISVVTGVNPSGDKVVVNKEYGGGLVAEFEASMPIVLGIQAARQTPRYVPVSRVRQAMRSSTLDEVPGGDTAVEVGSSVSRMFKPESGDRAEMIEGSVDDQVAKIVSLINEKGVK